MKKEKKYIILILILGIVFMPTNSYAENYGICLNNVAYQSDSKTGTISKTKWGTQYVTITTAFTSLTNPCPKCEFRVRPYKVDAGTLGGIIITMNSGKMGINTTDGSQETGSYYLKVARYDYTLLSTTVGISWDYQ